jgi:hypothetical protein
MKKLRIRNAMDLKGIILPITIKNIFELKLRGENKEMEINDEPT